MAVSHISVLLRSATKKRPLEPPNLVTPVKVADEKAKTKRMVAEEMAKILVQRGMENISEYDLKVRKKEERNSLYFYLKFSHLIEHTSKFGIFILNTFPC